MPPEPSHSLRTLHTFGIDSQANFLCTIHSQQELHTQWHSHSDPKIILGAGSNVLPIKNFEGTVILNRIAGRQIFEDPHHYRLEIGAGENWHQMVLWTLEQGIGGLENLALIPGNVGAAPVQNIGAYGADFAQFCDYVDVYQPDTNRVIRFERDACEFAYRSSIFKTHLATRHIITQVGLKIPKAWRANLNYGALNQLPGESTPRQIFDYICQMRRQKLPDPAILGNAGSFFKNPVIPEAQAKALKRHYPDMPSYPEPNEHCKLAAGWLIEQCGLKGLQIGNAAVHRDQALVLVNLGQATGRDVIALARKVKETVMAQFSIHLEPEVQLLGKNGLISLDEVSNE